jgi:hypothetical protein
MAHRTQPSRPPIRPSLTFLTAACAISTKAEADEARSGFDAHYRDDNSGNGWSVTPRESGGFIYLLYIEIDPILRKPFADVKLYLSLSPEMWQPAFQQ